MDALQTKIGYRFAKPELLVRALTHPSRHENNYQRLEFLGDSVLGLMVSELLVERFPSANEGELSRRLMAMVREEALADIAERWNVWDFVLIGDGEVKKSSILSDFVEAILGAVWQDGGLEAVRGIVRRDWAHMLSLKDEKDPKSRLQEWLQGQGMNLPEYEVVDEIGPAHDRYFKVRVLTQVGIAEGEGRSKQAAGAEAAAKFLREMGIA